MTAPILKVYASPGVDGNMAGAVTGPSPDHPIVTRADGYQDDSLHAPLGLHGSKMLGGPHLAGLPNGDFEDGIEGWTSSATPAALVQVDASASALGQNSIYMHCASAFDMTSITSGLVPVAEGVGLYVGARIALVSGGAAPSVAVAYFDRTRKPLLTATAVQPIPTAAFSDFGAMVVPPPGTRYAAVTVTHAGQVGAIRVDEAFLWRTTRDSAISLRLSYAFQNPISLTDFLGGDNRVAFSLRLFCAPGQFVADGAAWRRALAYLGALGGPRTLIDDMPQSVVTGARLVVPRQVTVSTDVYFEGADASSLPDVRFTDPDGGFYLLPASGLQGLSLTADNGSVDHLVEQAGQCGLDNLRLSYTVHGVIVTRKITVALSSANLALNTTSGLTNGTYPGVAFTGGSGSGATVSVVVSGGLIVSVTPDGAGAGYDPWFDYGFAAGALYPNSPAIPVVGQIATCNTGRSRYNRIWCNSQLATGIGFEIDCAYDFVDAVAIEVWDPSGIVGTSIGIKLGHIDGLNLDCPKLFGMARPIRMSAATTGAQSFGTIRSPIIDGCNLGIDIEFPIAELNIEGGLARTIGKGLIVNNPVADVTCTTKFYTTADASVALVDFARAKISSSFASPTSGANFPYIVIGRGTGAQQGTARFVIVGCGSDGRHPFCIADGTTKGGILAANDWPGRQYPATDANGNATPGYFTNLGGNSNVSKPISGGAITLVPDATARFAIPHPLGSAPGSPRVELVGLPAAGGYRASIVSIGTESVLVEILMPNGQGATTGTYPALWEA